MILFNMIRNPYQILRDQIFFLTTYHYLCYSLIAIVGRVHRVHIVAIAAFWRTFSHEGKISPGW